MPKTPDKEIPDEIYLQLVSSFFKEGRSLIIGSFIVIAAMLLCFVKTNAWPFALCAATFTSILLIRAAGMELFNRANQSSIDRRAAEKWERFYVTGATTSVGLLGAWCFLSFAITTDPFVRLSSFALTMGYIIGVFGRNFGNSKFVTMQTLAAWLPMSAALIIYGDGYHWAFALLMVPLFMGMSFIAQRIRQILLEAITARLKAETALENAKAEAHRATTARKRVLNLLGRLRQSRRRERAAIATRDQHMRFLATMSHEIRTPLNGIVGALDVLQTSPPDRIPHLVKTASLSAEALLEIVSEVLDLARLEYGDDHQPGKPFKSSDVLEFVRLALKPIATGKGLTLNVEVDKDVPNDLIGHPGKIRQVLINLVGNSLKFTETGAVTLTLRCLSKTAQRATLEIEVHDTGIGIGAADLERIYEPFYTSGNTLNRGTQSSGLGLAIVKKTIESIGGTIRCHSELGVGSTFTIQLDLEIDQAPEHSKEVEWTVVANPTCKPARILLVEDNDTNAMIIEDMLVGTNHSLRRATGGLEAVEMAVENIYDIILMDISMPDLNGVEACHRIQQMLSQHARPKIIALTANAIMGDRERYLAEGFDEYLSKPIRRQPLLATIQRIIENEASTSTESGQNSDDAITQVIDCHQFAEFLANRGQDRAQHLLKIFRTELLKHRDELKAACRDRQTAKAKHNLHTIVGMTGAVGAQKLSELARQLEHACRDGVELCPDAVDELFAEISATLRETSATIEMLSAKVA